jgi:peptidyl-prolyl cis-trans isomerase B (cyclophilin B)
MKLSTSAFLGLLALTAPTFAAEKPKMTEPATPKVKLQTTLGDVVLELDAAKAPGTVKNFLGYVKEGHYDGTVFHRVIPNFMAQGGGFTGDFTQKPTHAPIKNEADNGLRNKRGTIAMARTPDPDSATAQFFINFVDNAFLDYKSPTPQGWGYAVFGKVTEGMDVVDKMATIPTGRGGPMPTDVPQTPIVIEKASVVAE